jgi:arsenate reductase-like glutaredoxin family protein
VDGAVKETVNADKARLGPEAVLELLKTVKRVVATRGKQVVEFDLTKERPTDETLLEYLLGRTGNLRAPSAVVGKTLVVGFNPEAYQKVLGA